MRLRLLTHVILSKYPVVLSSRKSAAAGNEATQRSSDTITRGKIETFETSRTPLRPTMTARSPPYDPRAMGKEYERKRAKTLSVNKGGGSGRESEAQRRRLDRRELIISVGFLFTFACVVLALRLDHTPWGDVSNTMKGVLGLAKKGLAWNVVDRIALLPLLAVATAIEIVWSMVAIWLDMRVFRPMCGCSPGRIKKKGRGMTSNFGTVVAFAAFPLIISCTYSTIYTASRVRTWCYTFYALSVGAAGMMNYSATLASLVRCNCNVDFSLLFPTLPDYTPRYYRKKEGIFSR